MRIKADILVVCFFVQNKYRYSLQSFKNRPTLLFWPNSNPQCGNINVRQITIEMFTILFPHLVVRMNTANG